jgi:hypothetical protein
MAFEPETRSETAILLRANGRAKGQRPRYRRARFNLVSYDGDPSQYLEVRSACDLFDMTGVVTEPSRYRGLIERFEYFDDTHPFRELHDFSDSGL